MSTQITDVGVSIKIVTNGKPRFVQKTNIKTVEVLINTIIKIDIGKSSLYNIYVDRADVTIPASIDVNDLRDQIHTMLQPVGGGGGGDATAANQLTQTAELTAVKNNQAAQTAELTAVKNAILTTQNNQNSQTSELQGVRSTLSDIRATLYVVDGKMFYDPRIVDETKGNTIYKGFSEPGTDEGAPAWAILRETNVGGIIYYHWANGNKNRDKVWSDRETYAYT